MSKDNNIKNFPPTGSIFNDLVSRVKLVLRLLADSRISPWLKILPLGSALYFIIPDIAPGPVDDVAILWFGVYLFVEMCPQEIVQEHLDAMQQVGSGEWREPDSTDQVIDGDVRDK